MSEPKRLLIVGGVAGGASAAARARRLSESAEIVLLERGEFISFANCGLPYHIGGAIKDRERLLVQTPECMQTAFPNRRPHAHRSHRRRPRDGRKSPSSTAAPAASTASAMTPSSSAPAPSPSASPSPARTLRSS